MHVPRALLGAGLAASSHWCSTEAPTEAHLATMQSLRAAERDGTHLQRRENSTITVPVYMLGVVNSTNSDDTLSEEVLSKQFDVLVDRFAPYDITFTLQNITRIVDDDYSKGFDDNNWSAFKAANKKGDYATLNLYYVTNMDYESWGSGSCTLPGADRGGFLSFLDGCTLQSYTTPGGVDGDGKEYIGEITVHEVGHWLSLRHTFDDDCDGPGDYIDDTPAESARDLNVCPIGRDSCPGQPGLDPIHNYMDYTGEGCWEEFTPGQQARMHSAYWELRAPIS